MLRSEKQEIQRNVILVFHHNIKLDGSVPQVLDSHFVKVDYIDRIFNCRMKVKKRDESSQVYENTLESYLKQDLFGPEGQNPENRFKCAGSA